MLSLASLKLMNLLCKVFQLNYRMWLLTSKVRSIAKAPHHKMAPRPVRCCGLNGIAANTDVPLPKRPSNVNCGFITRRLLLFRLAHTFESRNTEYLRKVITQLIDAGVVPILATKADNREKDERINNDMALLAYEYDLPLWNFWAAVSDLPNRGLYTRDDRPLQGDIYLTDEAAQIHRMTGLEALNAVWRWNREMPA